MKKLIIAFLFLAFLIASCRSSRNMPSRTYYDAKGKMHVIVG